MGLGTDSSIPPALASSLREPVLTMKALASLLLISSVTIFVSPFTFAQPPVERVTLMLNGSGCESFSPSLEVALKELPGVRIVDGHSVPGHLLIDIEREQVTTDELARKVIEFPAAQNPCQVSVMQSCITAGVH